MVRWSHRTTTVVTILLVLVMSAMWTVPALADEGAPPPPAATEVVPPPGGPAPAELPAASLDKAPVTEKSPAKIHVVRHTDPVKDSTPHKRTSGEILAEVPKGTDVVVVNANGEVVSLATQEAAQALEGTDPIWCPAGALPRNGIGGCTKSYASLYDLVNDLMTGVIGPFGTNGVIWIQAGADASNLAINLDGLDPNLGNMENLTLTLNGGWNGLFGSTVLNQATPSIIDVPLSITNWNNNITLNNIMVSGASGALTYALDIATSKNITLTNVDVQGNSTEYGGAFLDNTDAPSGAGKGTGNVVVNDSTFNGNNGTDAYGLVVYSNGTIIGRNLTANQNTVAGAWLDNSTASTAKVVTLTGSNNFKFNDQDGLRVYSRGAITLSNVSAVYNAGNGAWLDNCAYDATDELCGQGFFVPVTLKGSNNFSNNGLDGLNLTSSSSITIANLTANDNGSASGNSYGAYLFNYGTWSFKPVTLTGVNAFNGNTGPGLWIDAWGPVITNNLTANDNGNGANCTSFACDGVHVADSSSLLLAGYGVFNGNGDDGMEAHSFGLVTLNNLYADGNGWWGVGVTANLAPVVVLGNNSFTYNGYTGLNISTSGAVTLANITSNYNGQAMDLGDVDGYGVYVDNAWKWVYVQAIDDYVQVPAGQAVTLTGFNTFDSNYDAGLEVHSSGVITTNNVTSIFNGPGVVLDNCLYNSDPAVDDCEGLPGRGVYMNGNNAINDNGWDGVSITSLGAIRVNNLTATFNGGNGAYLDNSWNRAVGGVTLTGFANTSMNGVAGLDIFSRGAVLTSNITANFNGPTTAGTDETYYRGVLIDNTYGLPMNVTMLGLNQFNYNWNTGLQIWSYGVVSLSNLTANGNGEPASADNPTPEGFGVNIDNSGSAAPKSVILNGVNVFNYNLDDGLDIVSHGSILVNRPTASGNQGLGAYLDNQWGVAASPLTILGYGVFNNNSGGMGLELFSNGNITLSNITANFNQGGQTLLTNYAVGGVYIDNNRFTATAAPVNVTLLGVNTFNGNITGDGLRIFSDGMITLNNITANDNQGGNGAYLDNQDYMKTANPRNIILNGFNTFVNNFYNGLEFHASGSVTMTRVNADFNDGFSNAYVGDGVYGSAGGSITLTCGSLNLNEGAGYNLTAGTIVTLRGVFSYGNGFADFSSIPTIFTRTCPLP